VSLVIGWSFGNAAVASNSPGAAKTAGVRDATAAPAASTDATTEAAAQAVNGGGKEGGDKAETRAEFSHECTRFKIRIRPPAITSVSVNGGPAQNFNPPIEEFEQRNPADPIDNDGDFHTVDITTTNGNQSSRYTCESTPPPPPPPPPTRLNLSFDGGCRSVRLTINEPHLITRVVLTELTGDAVSQQTFTPNSNDFRFTETRANTIISSVDADFDAGSLKFHGDCPQRTTPPTCPPLRAGEVNRAPIPCPCPGGTFVGPGQTCPDPRPCDNSAGIVAGLLAPNQTQNQAGQPPDTDGPVSHGIVDNIVQPIVNGVVILGIDVGNEVHVANCRAVDPVEDIVRL
jgi:hypothetical protein